MININHVKVFKINKYVTPDIHLYFSGSRYCFIELGYFQDFKHNEWRKDHIGFGNDYEDFYEADLSQRYKNLYGYKD